MYLHSDEGSSKMASTPFTDSRIPSEVDLFPKGLVFSAHMILAQYSGFKAMDSVIFDNVVRSLRFKW